MMYKNDVQIKTNQKLYNKINAKNWVDERKQFCFVVGIFLLYNLIL